MWERGQPGGKRVQREKGRDILERGKKKGRGKRSRQATEVEDRGEGVQEKKGGENKRSSREEAQKRSKAKNLKWPLILTRS